MKTLFAASLLVSGTLLFGSCATTTEEATVITDSTIMVMPAEPTTTYIQSPVTTDANGVMRDATGRQIDVATMTKNTDGSYTDTYGYTIYSDGIVKDRDGMVVDADYVRGKTITLDGTVRDRDMDGKVGTAEVEESLNEAGNKIEQGANAAGRGVEKGLDATGNALDKAGNAIERGAKATGRAVKKGANEVKGEYKDIRDGENNH